MADECRTCVEVQQVTDDETETVTFSVVGVERVYGRGDLVALAIVELELAGVSMTLQGLQVRRVSLDRITVALPAFKHPRDGVMRTAIVLPAELSDAIGASVAHAYEALELQTLLPDPTRSATNSATVVRPG